MNNIFENIENPLPPDFNERLSGLAKKLKSYDQGKNDNWYHSHMFREIYTFISSLFKEGPPIKLLEDILKTFKYERQKILVNEIPELMQAAGLNEATTLDGLRIKLKREVSCKQKSKPAVISWLMQNGYADFIKDKLELGKGELDQSLVDFLQEKGYTYKQDSGIHYQTLNKIIRERIESNEELPPNDVLHVEIINIAKIKED